MTEPNTSAGTIRTRTHRRPFIIPIFLPHSGCPHQCAFCNQKSIAGTSSHPLSPQAFHKLVENFLEFKGKRDKTTQIAFFGGNFLGQKKETIQTLLIEAETYIKTGRVDAIRFSTRPDTIDEDRLSLIKKHTVSTIELGVQSMDNRVLDLSNRGHTALDTQKAVFLLKKFGYEIGLQMMVGLPGDNTTKAMATAERMADLIPDFIRIYPTVVLNGSPLAKVYRAGNYTPLPLYACVTLVKKLYIFFTTKNIPVIRMGLQASETLDNGAAILAGPYHPAFGHLVLSEIFFDKAVSILKSNPHFRNSSADVITLKVNPKSVSKMIGQKKQNISKLKKTFRLKTVFVVADAGLSEDGVQIAIKI